ncbi:MAG: PHP domain-containing protein [Spirochaetaceae bacterium]|nr:PHP domain-containing protein [Spirochaetaceae bacterium]
MIDLHTHSRASDGALSPANLVALAGRKGIKALALTDHDTVDGVEEAESAARACGLRFVPGLEIEIEFNPGEFHLLGLGIDYRNDRLLKELESLAEVRQERNERIIRLFHESGIQIDMAEIKAQAGTSRIGRPHIADALVRNRVVRTRQEAFDRFLAKGKPFYLPKDCLDLDSAIGLIKGAGGVAVVAHPYSLFVSKTRLSELMDEWKESGIDGIEAYHSGAKLGQCRILEKMGRQRDFLITAGSDYHNESKPECGIGHSAGGVAIADCYYSELASRLPGLQPLEGTIEGGPAAS